jgi:hypothetical protein
MGQKKSSFGQAMVKKIDFWQSKIEFLAFFTPPTHLNSALP